MKISLGKRVAHQHDFNLCNHIINENQHHTLLQGLSKLPTIVHHMQMLLNSNTLFNLKRSDSSQSDTSDHPSLICECNLDHSGKFISNNIITLENS
jgi:hypothetical protein